VFLAWETLAGDAMSFGRLSAPFPDRYSTGIAYWFVTSRTRPRTRAVAAFHDRTGWHGAMVARDDAALHWGAVR
jgi:hypothetical protein